MYFETPANPNMRVIDIAAVTALVKAYNPAIKCMVDNTYCTPALQRPLTLGADIMVHSATKYLGGHGDLIAGAVVADAETIDDTHVWFKGYDRSSDCTVKYVSYFAWH